MPKETEILEQSSTAATMIVHSRWIFDESGKPGVPAPASSLAFESPEVKLIGGEV